MHTHLQSVSMVDHSVQARFRETWVAEPTESGAICAQSDRFAFDIPAEESSAALIRFGRQAGVTILLQHDARNTRLPGLKGTFTVRNGLERLLRGSELTYHMNDDGIVVRKVKAPVAASNEGTEVSSRRTIRAILDTVLAALMAAPVSVAAQATEGEGILAIEEVVVTATRREESLQDVPISITALTAQDIENTNAQSLRDLADYVPNFVFPPGRTPLEADISIRGIFANVEYELIGFDNVYSVYVDGVYQGSQSSANPDMMEIERVEVLRGPQGTLFGKNTIAGAINIISKKPTDQFEGSFNLEYGNLDYRRARAIVNVPLIEDVLAIRAAVGGTWRDGYVTNVTVGDDDLANINQRSGRVGVAYTPTSDFRAFLNIDALNGHTKAYNLEAVDAAQGDFIPYTIHSNALEKADQEKFGMSLTMEWDFGDGYTLTSITGYRDDESFFLKDVDETPLDILPFYFTGTQDLFSQELRITSPQKNRINYVAGLYYLDKEGNNFTRGVIGPNWIPPFAGDELYSDATVQTTSYAAFLTVNFELSDRARIFGGLRYTDDTKEMTVVQTSDPPETQLAFGLIPGNVPIDDITDDELTWSTGVQYDVSDAKMVYGSISRGYKSGSYTGVAIISVPALDNLIIDPEYVTSYEIGAKTGWVDNRLQANLAVFYMDYTDLQVRSYDPNAGVNGTGAQVWSNAGQVDSKGFELDLKARPTENLTLSAGIGYIHSRYGDFPGLSLARGAGNTAVGAPSVELDLNDGTIDGRTDATGNEVPLSPKWNLSLVGQYDHSLNASWDWMGRVEYQYVDTRYSADGSANFDADELLPSYDVFNARVGVTSTDGKWGIHIWAKNLLDENELVENRFSGFGYPKKEQRYMEPRTYGVTLDFYF